MSESELEVMVITVDEYYYIPKFLEPICSSDTIDVVSITTVPPSLGTETMPRFVLRLLRTFGPRVFSRHAAFYSKYLVLDLIYRHVGIGQPYSSKSIASEHEIEYLHTDNINSGEFKSYAANKSPDVIASIAATQKFDSGLLNIPERGAVNIHSSLLPQYRGISPTFWTLLNDEDQTGLTVHYMDEDLDAGDIILQQPLAIRTDESQHSLHKRIAAEGAEVLLAALEQIRVDSVDATPMDSENGSYYSMPEREDVREFLSRGNTFY